MKNTAKIYINAVIILFFSNSVNATLFTDVSASINAGGINGFVLNDSKSTDNALYSSSIVSGSSIFSTVTSSAYASYGTLKIFTNGETIILPDQVSEYGDIRGGTNARFTDNFTINKDGYEGAKGLLNFGIFNEVFVDATSRTNNTAWANYGFSFLLSSGNSVTYMNVSSQDYEWFNGSQMGGEFIVTVEIQDYYSKSATATGGFPRPNMPFTHEFVFGEPIHIDMIASGGGRYTRPQSQYDELSLMRFLVDGGSSSYWGGISSITIDGMNVADYNLLSGSGTDYSRSFIPTSVNPVTVPEPNTLILFSIAIFILMMGRNKTDVFLFLLMSFKYAISYVFKNIKSSTKFKILQI